MAGPSVHTYNSQISFLTQTINNAPQNLILTVPTGAIISNFEITTTQTASPGLIYTVSSVDTGGTGTLLFNRLSSSTPTLLSGVRDVLVTPDKPMLLNEETLGLTFTQASKYISHVYLSYKVLNQNGLNFSPNFIQSTTTTVSASNTNVLTVPAGSYYKILSIYSTAAVSSSSKISCYLTQTGIPSATTPFCDVTLTGVSGALTQSGSIFNSFYMEGGQELFVSAANYPVNITVTYTVVS